MIGKTFAHYRILDKLGAGGMGEVWRASDSRLGREVALKLLPESFAKDAERMARFHREAQVLASLNHPNIAAIHGLETEGETSALALELVEGPTLADRLRAGPMEMQEALALALQIAEAVEYAHESGVVHRDLKPENVKIAADGRVKVLDFGLAKAMSDDPAQSGAASALSSPTISPALTSPVITGALTGANVILGTAAYMSPEQARGQTVDKRADIWAFGVVLFEMLTGRRLFAGETISDTLAAVLKTDPPWEQLPAETPPRIERLLRRCLERNPKERLRDIGDARLLLSEVLEGRFPEGPAAGDATAAAEPAARRRPWLLPAAMIASAVVAAAALWMLRPTPPEPPLRKFALAHPATGPPTDLALAPDGSALAFVRDGALHVQSFGEVEDRELVTGDDLYCPFWSPDGEWIAYGADQALWKIRRTGGAPVRLAPLNPPERLTSVAGGVWGEDGRIVFASGSEGLWQVSAQGGDVSVLATPQGDINDFHDVGALPGNAGWLVVLHGPDAYDTIAAILPDGSRRDLVHVPGEALFLPQWSATGHVVFSRGGSARGVYAIPVKAGAWTAAGEPFLIAAGYRFPSLSREGTLAMIRGVSGSDRVLCLVDRSGAVLRTFEPTGRWSRWPTLSPDGKQLLAELADGESRDLWLIDTERGSRQRFTDDDGTEWWGVWSADGSEILYSNGDGASSVIRARPASGAGEFRELFPGVDAMETPDGRWFLSTRVDTSDADTDNDIWLMPGEEGTGEPRPLVKTPASDRVAFPSPNGDPFVVYVSDRSGRNEVYLTTYPEVRGHWPVSIGGGDEPRWRGDGRELYYAKGDSVMTVDVEAVGGKPRLGPPKLLFLRPDAGRLQSGWSYSAHPSADGRTFAISMQPERKSEDPVSIVVVQNWFEEFRKP